jgi:hypothetical protein
MPSSPPVLMSWFAVAGVAAAAMGYLYRSASVAVVSALVGTAAILLDEALAKRREQVAAGQAQADDRSCSRPIDNVAHIEGDTPQYVACRALRQSAHVMDAEEDFDRDDDFHYDEVALEDEGGEGADELLDLADDDRALDALVRSVQATKDRDAPPPVRADLTRLPVVVDDFIRNYFVKHGFHNTLDTFEQEWYQRYGANPEDEPKHVPDVYLENARLIDRTAELDSEVAKHKEISTKAMTLWERVKKERDLHRMNHHRVMQEKSTMSRDLKRLQSHSMSIEPTVTELRQKYEQCQKICGRLAAHRVSTR